MRSLLPVPGGLALGDTARPDVKLICGFFGCAEDRTRFHWKEIRHANVGFCHIK